MRSLYMTELLAAVAGCGADSRSESDGQTAAVADAAAQAECTPLTCGEGCYPNLADVPCDGQHSMLRCENVTVVHGPADPVNIYESHEYVYGEDGFRHQQQPRVRGGTHRVLRSVRVRPPGCACAKLRPPEWRQRRGGATQPLGPRIPAIGPQPSWGRSGS